MSPPPPNEDDAERMPDFEIDLGCDHFEIARLYGLGNNEALLSRALKTHRDKLFLAPEYGIGLDDGNRRIDHKAATIHAAKKLPMLSVDHVGVHDLNSLDFDTPIKESVGITPAQLALGWVLSRADHILAIPGT